MVLAFPFSFGFGFLCVMGSLFAISSSHWLGVWLGLELNLLGFIPLMVQGFSGQSVESAIKYFVVQALGSGFILLGGFCLGESLFFWFLGSHNVFLFIYCFFGLCLKLGVAPLHWWVPSVVGGLNWFSCGILLTWQKLAPFFVLLSVSYSFFVFLVVFGVISSLVGGFLGVGQVQVRLLMAYSSIGHWGWLLSLLSFSFVGGLCYFIFYFLLSVGIFYFFFVTGVYRFSQVSSSSVWFVLVGFTSLGGLPPLSGFILKLVGIQILVSVGSFFVLGFLILGSLLSLFYYLSLIFIFFLTVDKSLFSFLSPFYKGPVSFFLVLGVFGFPFYEVFFYVLYAVGLLY